MKRNKHSAPGYALPLVLLILAVLAAAISAMVYVMTTSARSSSSVAQQRRVFYECDGIARTATRAAQNALLFNPAPTPAQLKSEICAQGGGCGAPMLPAFTSGGLEVVEFDVVTTALQGFSQIPNGPFEGMRAQVNDLSMRIVAEHPTSGYRCAISQDVTLGKVALFQFFVFSDVAITDWSPGPVSVVTGRVHFNGKGCLGGNSGFTLNRVTAAGELYNGNGEPNCPRDLGSNVFIVDGGGIPKPFKPAADHGCANCDGSGLAWRDYAQSAFGGNVQDVDHSVPVLRAPVSGSAPVQAGIDASNNLISNAGTMRFLIDPPRIGSDNLGILSQKYACKSDVRIVNGVWYIRDNSAGDGCGGWPGVPIYSDHAGSYTTTNAEGVEGSMPVGQRDMYDDVISKWAARGSSPERYSYYYSNPVVNSAALQYGAGKPPAVVSYGSLFRVNGTTWVPGPVVQNATGLCTGTCAAAPEIRRFDDAQLSSRAEALLAATRSGFRDHQIETEGVVANADVLPMNFDLAAFQLALQDLSDGELGDVFQNRFGRPFNGIVYIASLWPGQMNGFPNGFATMAPPQGGDFVTLGPLQNQVLDPRVANNGVPFSLCAGNTGANVDPYTANIPRQNCAAPAAPSFPLPTTAAGYPSAIRIINASAVSPAVLPDGISIVSNLPMFLIGPTNATSVPGGTPWLPVMFGGDVIGFLSDQWSDHRALWELSNGDGNSVRKADPTVFNLELMAGWATSTTTDYSGGVENFPRYLEDWDNDDHFINGSLVIGWTPVLRRVIHGGSSFRDPPVRTWNYDVNLDAIGNQPPGSPLFDVVATKSWQRF